MSKAKNDVEKSEAKQPNIWALGGTISLVFFFVMVMKLAERDPVSAIPVIAIVAGTMMIVAPIWLYFHYRRDKASGSEKSVAASDPQEQLRIKRMEERMENLEALICRLDSELSQQIETSMMMARAPSADPQVSQMPTSFVSVASALEDRFQVLREIGRGGMGVVFQAYDKQLKEQVAIKVLSPMLSNNAEALERLKREVSAARRVTNSNVIRIHDISESHGLSYVSMEYFNGTSLKDYIRQHGALSMMQAYQIVSQICDGLEAAHQQGVIHRDLKSQNIIINSANQIKIIDFGLARTTHLDGMTVSGLIMGTPEYMAPEQVAGKKVDERADIYSLGIILFEVFTGKLPFTGDSAISIGFKQIKDDPPAPREINPQVSEEVERVILRALQKEPLQRYRSVSELKRDLEMAVKQPAPGSQHEDRKEARIAQTVRE